MDGSEKTSDEDILNWGRGVGVTINENYGRKDEHISVVIFIQNKADTIKPIVLKIGTPIIKTATESLTVTISAGF